MKEYHLLFSAVAKAYANLNHFNEIAPYLCCADDIEYYLRDYEEALLAAFKDIEGEADAFVKLKNSEKPDKESKWFYLVPGPSDNKELDKEQLPNRIVELKNYDVS